MPTTTVPQPHWHPIWTPADYHETFTRAATVQAIRAVADERREVRESALLAEWLDREVRA